MRSQTKVQRVMKMDRGTPRWEQNVLQGTWTRQIPAMQPECQRRGFRPMAQAAARTNGEHQCSTSPATPTDRLSAVDAWNPCALGRLRAAVGVQCLLALSGASVSQTGSAGLTRRTSNYSTGKVEDSNRHSTDQLSAGVPPKMPIGLARSVTGTSAKHRASCIQYSEQRAWDSGSRNGQPGSNNGKRWTG
jgi:hypothetical protein